MVTSGAAVAYCVSECSGTYVGEACIYECGYEAADYAYVVKVCVNVYGSR